MSIEDLEERIDELKQKNEELQSELDNHSEELSCREQCGYNKGLLESESKIQHAFGAGFDCGLHRNTDAMKLKLFLDYKMEQRS